MSMKPSTLVTEAEFLALPVTMTRCELLDGEVIVAPAPSAKHQIRVGRIHAALLQWAKSQATPVFVGLSPFDLRFAEGRILQPDVFVILGPVDEDLSGPWNDIPDLCAEVVSLDRVYDRVTKRLIYAASGVKELSQPFAVAEQFTGLPGKYVNLEETVASFERVLSGEFDQLPEQAFYMQGGIDDVIARARELQG